jgi:hypothetical protein
MARIGSLQESSPPFVSSSDPYSIRATPKLRLISDRKCRHNESSDNRAGGFPLLEVVQRCEALRWSVPRSERFTNLPVDFGRSEFLLPYRYWGSY